MQPTDPPRGSFPPRRRRSLRFSIAEHGRDLFAAAEPLDLKGIVAKRKADAYRPETVWYKIKSRTYTQGEGRWELFQMRRP
jgi:ATP-dependent DNA ligase